MNLTNTWFVLLGFFWSAYFVLEGFDLGVGMLLPFVPRGERERDAMFDTIGPVWDGNEVWLVIAGAVTFAAFPTWYGTMFSSFYLAFLLILFFLIIRVVSFEWREKVEATSWRWLWLWANFVGSVGIPFVWGVGFSNLLHGLALDSAGVYTGTFADLFTGYTVLGGIAFVLLFAFHGATFLTLRTTGELYEHAKSAARGLAIPAVVVGAGYLVWTVVVAVDRNDQNVFPPVLPAVIAGAAFVLALLFVFAGKSAIAFVLTAVGTVAVVATLFTSLYPRVMVSYPDFGNSLTVSGSASAHYTLAVMSVVALICVPVILLYEAWTYYVFRARVTGRPVGPTAAAPPPGPAASAAGQR